MLMLNGGFGENKSSNLRRWGDSLFSEKKSIGFLAPDRALH